MPKSRLGISATCWSKYQKIQQVKSTVSLVIFGTVMRRRKPIRQINLRISDELRRELEVAAQERRISINQLMRQLLEAGLENENKAKQSLENRVRRLEDLVQRYEPPLPLLEAEKRQREQEEGGNT